MLSGDSTSLIAPRNTPSAHSDSRRSPADAAPAAAVCSTAAAILLLANAPGQRTDNPATALTL